MTVPPRHTAVVRTELFCPVALRLQHRLSAVKAGPCVRNLRMPADMGIHGIRRKVQPGSNLCPRYAVKTHIVDGELILWFHNVPPMRKEDSPERAILPKVIITRPAPEGP